jgi:hypothetical protein
MKRITFFWMMLWIGGSVLAQTAKLPLDTIIRLGGKKIPCKVVNVSSSTILYNIPGKSEAQAIERKEVERIIRSNGSKEDFNKPVVAMIEEGQWQSVLVTKNKKDVQGLYNRGVITARSAPTSSYKKSKQSAITILQKKAANLKGSIIYITKEETRGNFGDVPAYEIEAIVYGTEPLEKGTDVVDDNKK